MITIQPGESPNAEDVLNALSNVAFHPNGSPWEANAEQVAKLIEIFGEGPGPDGDAVDDFVTAYEEGR